MVIFFNNVIQFEYYRVAKEDRLALEKCYESLYLKEFFHIFLMGKVLCLKSRTFTVVTFKFGGGEKNISRKYGVAHNYVLRWPLAKVWNIPVWDELGWKKYDPN